MNAVERLREYAEASRWGGVCRILHAHHGDSAGDCSERECNECRAEYLRAVADEMQANMRDAEARMMPGGMEWPRYEDGKQVRIGDVVSDVEVRSVVFRDGGILLSDCTSVPGWGTWRSYKEPIKRPAPKVPDADGAEIRVGDTVYGFAGQQYEVTGLCEYEPSIVHAKTVGDGVAADELLALSGQLNSAQLEASKLTHRAPVLAADGKPLEAGQTVWTVDAGIEFEVHSIEGDTVWGSLDGDRTDDGLDPKSLTHEQPDSWQRIEEDCEMWASDYAESHGLAKDKSGWSKPMRRDLVRRAKKLAGVDND